MLLLGKENDGRAGSLLATRILFQEDDVIVGIASPPFSAFTNCIRFFKYKYVY